MEIVYGIVLVLHLIGWALVLGGAIYGLRESTMNKGMLHGILTALIAGLIMMHEGRIVVDIEGERKRRATVADLLDAFERVKGAELDDRTLLQ